MMLRIIAWVLVAVTLLLIAFVIQSFLAGQVNITGVIGAVAAIAGTAAIWTLLRSREKKRE